MQQWVCTGDYILLVSQPTTCHRADADTPPGYEQVSLHLVFLGRSIPFLEALCISHNLAWAPGCCRLGGCPVQGSSLVSALLVMVQSLSAWGESEQPPMYKWGQMEHPGWEKAIS